MEEKNKKINASRDIFFLIGRLCICVIFIITGIWKIIDFSGVSQEMAAKGMIMVPFILTMATFVEIIGGVSLFFGYKTRFWAAILMLYLIPVTLIYHDFWNADGAQRYTQIIQFLKNLTIIGGLWDVMGAGAGKMSLDAYFRKTPKS